MIIVAHRSSALAAVDQVLVMVRGVQQALGPRDELLSRSGRREASTAAPLKVVPRTGG